MMVVVTPTVVASDGEVLNRNDHVTPIKAKTDIVTCFRPTGQQAVMNSSQV